MFFKFGAKNIYRDFIKNCRRITIADISDEEKIENYKNLYETSKPRLRENETCLNQSPAFHANCIHWNQRTEIRSIRPVTNDKNPWLRFKREFLEGIESKNPVKAIGTSLAWFYAIPESTRNDWLVN